MCRYDLMVITCLTATFAIHMKSAQCDQDEFLRISKSLYYDFYTIGTVV